MRELDILPDGSVYSDDILVARITWETPGAAFDGPGLFFRAVDSNGWLDGVEGLDEIEELARRQSAMVREAVKVLNGKSDNKVTRALKLLGWI